jgi:predicted RNase H-like HicB family nuclease
MSGARGRRQLAMSEVRFQKDDGWYVVSLPGVPGAYTQGRTKNSAYNNLLSLLRDLEKARRDGLIK